MFRFGLGLVDDSVVISSGIAISTFVRVRPLATQNKLLPKGLKSTSSVIYQFIVQLADLRHRVTGDRLIFNNIPDPSLYYRASNPHHIIHSLSLTPLGTFSRPTPSDFVGFRSFRVAIQSGIYNWETLS